MENRPVFSVVITVFNKENYIRELLKACLNLVEICAHVKSIVIIDDCSTDSSLHVISDFIENCESSLASRFIVNKLAVNSGPQLARIKGIDLAESEWIILIDGDDLIYPYSVSKVCDYIVENSSNIKHIALVYGNCPVAKGTVTLEHIKDSIHKNDIGNISINSRFKYAVSTGKNPLMSGLFLRRQYAHMMKNNMNNAAEDILFLFVLLQYSPFLHLDIDIGVWRRNTPEGSRSDRHGMRVRIRFMRELFRVKVYKNTKSLRRTFEATVVRIWLLAKLLASIFLTKVCKLDLKGRHTLRRLP